ncbi:MAG: alanine racemase [Candidatus Pacebacteria bacterium]|nr:alanine racemase [Candidatus Paceibacterota bacterium]
MKEEKIYKTWIELSSNNLKNNIGVFKNLLDKKTKLFAVVKSNAYGHGLEDFSRMADKFRVDGFCVDSIIEGIKLRSISIKKPILVIGPSIPGNSLLDAKKNDITISISNLEALKIYSASKAKPDFHLKIDTGMHRQGLQIFEMSEAISIIKKKKLPINGAYTHFASAKDPKNTEFTNKQFNEFNEAIKLLETAGLRDLAKHCSATGGTLLDKKYHLDMVRVGIGLYGMYPSEELKKEFQDKYKLLPVLSWKALVSEVKEVKSGEGISYDLVEKLIKDSKIAIIPIGYWHGYPRSLTSVGKVLINSKECKVLGRVCMDMIIVDVSNLENLKLGNEAVLIGKSENSEITLEEISQLSINSTYEFITRINPLIKKIII